MMIDDHDDNFVVIDDADDCLFIMVSFHLHFFFNLAKVLIFRYEI